MPGVNGAVRIVGLLLRTFGLGLGLWIAGSNITSLRAEESEAERTLVDKVLAEPDQEQRMEMWRRAVVAAPDADSRARMMNAVPVLQRLGQGAGFTPEQQREALLLAMDKGSDAGLSLLNVLPPRRPASETLGYRSELLTRILGSADLGAVEDLLARELKRVDKKRDEELASRLERASVIAESLPLGVYPSDPEVQLYFTQVLLLPDEDAGPALAIVQGGLVRDLEFLRRGWRGPEAVMDYYQLSVAKGWWYSCLMDSQDDNFSFSYTRQGRKCDENELVVVESTTSYYMGNWSSDNGGYWAPEDWRPSYTNSIGLLPSMLSSSKGWTIEMVGEPVLAMRDLRTAYPDRSWPTCNVVRNEPSLNYRGQTVGAYNLRTGRPVTVELPATVRPEDCWSSMKEAEQAVAESNRLLHEQVQEAAAARRALESQ